MTGIDVTATAMPMIIDSENGLLLGPAYVLKSYALETASPIRNGRIVAPSRNATAVRLSSRLNVPWISTPETNIKRMSPNHDTRRGVGLRRGKRRRSIFHCQERDSRR